MTDPNPFVEAITKDGSKVYIRAKAARAYGFTVTDGKAVDGHGHPLPAKPKRVLRTTPAQAKPAAKKEN